MLFDSCLQVFILRSLFTFSLYEQTKELDNMRLQIAKTTLDIVNQWASHHFFVFSACNGLFMLRLEHELFLCIALCRRAHENFCNDQITAINEQVTNSGSLLSVQTLCRLQKVLGKSEGSKTLSNSKMFLRTSKKVRVLKKRKPVKPRDPRFSEELCQTFRGSFWVYQRAPAFPQACSSLHVEISLANANLSCLTALSICRAE